MTEQVVDDNATPKEESTISAEQAFEASFNGQELPAPTPTPTPEPTPAPTPEPTPAPTQPPATPEAAPSAPSPKADDDLRQDLRKLYGHIGALKDELKRMQTAKQEDGKPANLTPFELKRMKEQFPDFAAELQADISEVLASIAPKTPDPKEVETIVDQRVVSRVQAQMAEMRASAVTDAHENWKQDLWVDGKLGEQRTPEYQAWLKTMTDAEGQAFEASSNPYHVIRKLNQFYDWKAATAKAQADAAEAEKAKQERLKANVTPKGVARAGPTNLSPDEALRKGFEEGFNS